MSWEETINYARMMARKHQTRYYVGGSKYPDGAWRYGAYPAMNR